MVADIASNFGANIQLSLPDPSQQHLFLVKSTHSLSRLVALISARGGQVTFKGSNWVIAQLTFEAGMSLNQEQGIVFVGGTFLDTKRFLAFNRLFNAEDQGNAEDQVHQI
jgi:hypothetical protein